MTGECPVCEGMCCHATAATGLADALAHERRWARLDGYFDGQCAAQYAAARAATDALVAGLAS